MGDLTRTELRDEVKANLGRKTDDDVDARVNRQLHLAQLRIARAHPWTELYANDSANVIVFDNPDADQSYTLFPARLKDIYSLNVRRLSDDRANKVEWIPQRDWDQLIAETSLHPTGKITKYTRWGSTIYWYRTPDEVFTLYRRYDTWPADFANDADTSDLENKDDIIIAFATSMLFQSIGNTQDAGRWFTIAAGMLNTAIGEEMQKPDISRRPRGAGDAAVRDGVNYWQDPFVKGVFTE